MSQDIIEHGAVTGADIVPRGGTVQQVRSSFCTAVRVQQRRNIAEVERQLCMEASRMGDDAFYGWRAGKENIEGPSIDLAVAAARCWGNCATDMLPVQDMPDCWIFTAAFIDLETGYTRTRQFRQSKNTIEHGRMDDERKDDIRFQKGQSKAERNVILKALPSWLINAAIKAAKDGVRSELDRLIKNHGARAIIDRLIIALGKCGVKESAVMAKCGVKERAVLSTDHLVVLRGDLNALQSGQERVEVLFPAVETPQSQPEAASGQSADSAAAAEAPPPTLAKDQLAALDELAKRLRLTPVDKEELCSQGQVKSFAEMTSEYAGLLIRNLEEAIRRREAATAENKQPQPREPGCDDE